MSGSDKGGALEGIRVIDLTQMLAGPYCTQTLADHGADVIKVEPPAGDRTRSVGPFRPDDSLRAFGGYFASVNRNKRSIVLDLKQVSHREAFLALVRTADVVVENFRQGVMDRFGLSYETLHNENPKLVYAAIRGFGDSRTGDSPYNEWPAYDIVAQAMGGIISITGPNKEVPTKIGPGIGDLVPGVMMAFGIVAALHHANRTGQGQFLDVAMVDGVLSICERIIHQWSFAGTVAVPEGNRHPILSPFGLVPARDGWIAIGIAESASWWKQLCEIISRPDLIVDPRTSTQDARIKHQDLVYETISAFTRQRDKAELMRLFGGVFPFGPVYSSAEIVRDPHFEIRKMIVAVEQPGSQTPVHVAGIPVHFLDTPGSIRRRAPLLGEDTAAILAEVGLSLDTLSVKENSK
ncbi:CaiB/BaiF CoA transferase family protein [Bradyrhizobium commune]|uniref:CoA transferase n=1 Tax=Bradyrhizobium commune TaxID=83627 RepID=A0A7S9D403_9BRAD|nr:CoA transferase [Bradyrhizobium commune]QPF90726.1 CoA transferase [Bradyrhizobium commune]